MTKTLRKNYFRFSAPFKNLLTVLLLFVMGLGSAQIANYEYDASLEPDTGFSYSPITGTDLFGPTWENNSNSAVPIGFSFVFNGISYTTLKVSSNGFIAFGGSTNLSATDYAPISRGANTNYVGTIAAFGRRLANANFGNEPIYAVPSTGVSYTTTGPSGSQVFIVQWENAVRYNNATSPFTGLLNFQIRLYEGSNAIEIHFAPTDVPTTTSDTQGGQCGIRGVANTEFSNRRLPTPPGFGLWTSTEAGVFNTNAMNFRNNSYPTYTFRLRWNAPCLAPSAPVVSNVQPTSADANWTVPVVAPAGGYDWMVVSSGENPNSVTPAAIEASGNTTDNFVTPITGLPGGTTMVFWVRSNCGGGRASNWFPSGSFTTSCDPTGVPYIQNFNATSVGAIPPCTSTQVVSGNPWSVQQTPVVNGFSADRFLRYAFSGNVANSWFYTQRVSLTAGSTYYISYKYGASDPTLTERLRVAYSTSNTSAAMLSNVLVEHPEVKNSPIFNTVHFTPTVSGDYYFGFQSWSAASQEFLLLDDIRVDVSSCLVPTGLNSASVTAAGATIFWNQPTPVPSGGYAYYVSTSATPPSYGQLPTGLTAPGSFVVGLNNLNPSTTYYVWVRSNCGSAGFGEWSAVHSFTTQPAPPAPICNPSSTSVDGQGIVRVQLGNIDNITGTEPLNYGNYSNLVANLARGETHELRVYYNTGTWRYRTRVWVDWNQDGVFDEVTELMDQGISPGNTPQFLSLNIPIPVGVPLGVYRVRIGGKDTAFVGPCYVGFFSSFEDYSINVIETPAPLALTLSSDSICLGESTALVQITGATVGNYNAYSWVPSAGVSGNPIDGYTFSPAESTVYTLTGFQLSAPFSVRSVTFTVNIQETPSPVSFVENPALVCATGNPVMLVKEGGILGGVVIESQNFNDSSLGGGWSTTINSTGGNTANSAFTLRPSGTTIAGQIHISNDNSQFLVSNSDSQGSGNTTNVNLFSPVLDLSTYSAAQLTFYHYYRAWTNGGVSVQVSTNGMAGPWTTVMFYGASQTQGARDNFKEENINLNAYTGPGFDNVVLRWNYTATFGWSWALDNITLIGSAPSPAVWSPTTGLFTNAAGTVPYTGTPTVSVYAKPNSTTTYTATVTSLEGCTASADILVEVPVLVTGGLGGDQDICSGVPSDVILLGNAHPVVRWEYSNSSTFSSILGSYANSTETLTGAEIGSDFDVRYVRAVISDGVCEAYSPAVGVFVQRTIFEGASWTNFEPDETIKAVVDFSGNYTFTGSLEACSLEIVSGNVTIASGATLNIKNEVIVADGATLTFENGTSLIQESDIANSGSIRYRRNSTGMFLLDYTYWSSPVMSQDLYAFSPFTNFSRKYEWNASTQGWTQLFGTSASHVAGNVFSTPGKGFIVRAPGNGPIVFYSHTSGNPRVVFPGEFLGVPNNGTITVATSANGDGFNLLGNPYPSAIDVHAFLLDPANIHLERTIKYWTHNTPITNNVYTASDYATYNFTGPSIDDWDGIAGNDSGFNANLTVPGRYMASGQGFVIDALSDGMATFRNSHRVSGNNNVFFRMAEAHQLVSAADAIEMQEKHRIWLTMNNHYDLKKSLLVGYVAEATNGYDNGYDGKFSTSGYGLEFYSVLDATPLTIQGRALPFTDSDLVPLGYFAQQSGVYSISMSNKDGLFQNQTVYIEDLLTGEIHPLHESAYSFVTEAGRYDQRFVLRYTNETLSVNAPQFGEHHVVIYKEHSSLLIQTQETEMSEVVLYDMSGRRLVSQQGDLGTLVRFDQLQIAQQVLMVEIVTLDKGSVYKKYVY
jgi:hypothetical protein